MTRRRWAAVARAIAAVVLLVIGIELGGWWAVLFFGPIGLILVASAASGWWLSFRNGKGGA